MERFGTKICYPALQSNLKARRTLSFSLFDHYRYPISAVFKVKRTPATGETYEECFTQPQSILIVQSIQRYSGMNKGREKKKRKHINS